MRGRRERGGARVVFAILRSVCTSLWVAPVLISTVFKLEHLPRFFEAGSMSDVPYSAQLQTNVTSVSKPTSWPTGRWGPWIHPSAPNRMSKKSVHTFHSSESARKFLQPGKSRLISEHEFLVARFAWPALTGCQPDPLFKIEPVNSP